jgi:hypothetical protein
MAQTTRSSSSRAAGGRSRTKKSTSRNSRNGTSASRSRARSQSSNGPVEKTTEKVSQLASKAKPPATAVRKTGGKVANAASKAKTPLVAGGAALAGIAGGLALKSRTETKRPTKRFRTVQLPRSLRNIDLDQLVEAGRRVRSIGEQVGDVADTAAKTRKKHN